MQRRFLLFGGAIAFLAQLVGCGESIPPPSPSDPKANMPDEVRQAEEAFEKKNQGLAPRKVD